MKRVLCVLAVLGVAAILVGCAGRVTKEKYDKIEVGMTMSQVKAILGEPDDVDTASGAIGELGGSATVATWRDGDAKITVTFINDKVTTYSQVNVK